MPIPKLHLFTYTIGDLSTNIALQQPNIAELRQRTEILIIDDQDFLIKNSLVANGFHLTHKSDIDSIRDVASYQIILCDISGVGKVLGSSKEGAFIIKEVKAQYPYKQVIAYTSYAYDTTYNEYIKSADLVIPKGTSLDDWITILDDQIKKTYDPIYQWVRFRNYLLVSNVTTLMAARIEDDFVKAMIKKDVTKLNNLANSTNSEMRTIIIEFVSSVCVKLLLGIVI